MTLPAPNLDDRGFQDLVDEAKRMVQVRNPTWTDHNVSDPGVTLIETFAFLVDQLIYRLNRVPDLHYVKFLDLLGERMIPPASAIAPIEFWLSVAQETDVVVERGTEVSTVRVGLEQPVVFTTMDDLVIPAVSEVQFLTKAVDGPFVSHAEAVSRGVEFPLFSAVPQVGDGVYIGLDVPVPHCFVRIQVDGDENFEGVGVDPKRPPIVVEAWDGQAWVTCPLRSDATGGLNRPGPIDIYVPRHARSSLGGVAAAWLRIVVVPTVGDQPAYTATPEQLGFRAETTGGMCAAAHAEAVEADLIGPCSGTPGDRLQLSEFPLVSGQGSLVIEVSDAHGWQTWNRVESFADSGPEDHHFTVDDASGTLTFGPLIRGTDGNVRNFGATPATGAMVRIPRYLTGGGIRGNVEAKSITMLRTSIPFISRVNNPQPASGGMDGETIDDVKARAAITVRTQMRAVTARDYELLAKMAAPSLARVDCLDADALGKPGHVLVQVIPSVPEEILDFEILQPREAVLRAVRDFLDERRPLGSVVHIEPPKYLGASVAARLVLETGADRDTVLHDVDRAIKRYMHPTMGGYAGTGWQYGRPLLVGDIHAIIQRVPGVSYVDVVRLVPADIVTGARGVPTDRIEPAARELIFCVGNDLEVMG